jgi:CRP-like cAMP-binding protein
VAARQGDRLELLARTPLFAGLEERDLRALVGAARLKRLRAREELLRKGDEVAEIYVVAEGRLKAFVTSREGDDVAFSIMGPGEVIGEVALLAGGRRTGTVVAMEPCEILVLDRRDFLQTLRSRPEVAIRLLEVLAVRLERLTSMLEDVQFLNLPARLAKKLLALAEQYGRESDEGLRIELRLSQTELGDLIATSRESVNKQLRAWTEAGLVSMRRGIVTLHHPEELEALASTVPD